MLIFLFIWGILSFFSTLTVAKNELHIIVLDVNFIFNPKYFAPGGEAYLLDNGIDNEIYVNFTVIKTIPETTMARFRILGATRGEYIVPIGIDQVMTLPIGIVEPILGAKFTGDLGITECPILPGNYGSPSMIAYDSDKLPETFFRKNFLSTLFLYTPENEEIMRVDMYTRTDYFKINK